MRRRAGFLFIFGAMAPLVIVVSSAWACGVLATLKAAPSTAAPGQAVSVAGSNYSSDTTTFTPVQVRLDRRDGTVLKDVAMDPGTKKLPPGTTFQLPGNTSAGDHVLLATQTKISDGTQKAGTPGRTVVRVQGAAVGSSVPVASPWSDPKPGGPGGSPVSADAGGFDGSPFLAIALSLALLSIGVTLVRRDTPPRGGRRPLLGA